MSMFPAHEQGYAAHDESELTLEERLENPDEAEPWIFEKYFDFLLWPIGRVLIMLLWLGMTILGMSYGFGVLDATIFDFSPPEGTDGHRAQMELKRYFRDVYDSSSLVIYYECGSDCSSDNSYSSSYDNGTDEETTIMSESEYLSNISSDMLSKMMDWSENHKHQILEYHDYYTALPVCSNDTLFYNQTNRTYSYCSGELEKIYFSDDYHSMLGFVKYKDDVSQLRKNEMNDKVSDICSDVQSDYRDNQGISMKIRMTGMSALMQDMNEASRADVEQKDVITIPLALVVLGCVVQTWRVMFIPLLSVIASICTSYSIMRPVAENALDVNPFAPSIMMSVTTAMSIDYSLFLLTRFREEIERQELKLKRGQIDRVDVVHCVRQMTRWSGKVVALSGAILTLCYIGLIAYPMQMLRSVGLGAATAVASTIFVNLTLTPALILTFPRFFSVLGLNCRLRKDGEVMGKQGNDDLLVQSGGGGGQIALFASTVHYDPTGADEDGIGASSANNSNAALLSNGDGDDEEEWLEADEIHPFRVKVSELQNPCNRCWYECGGYSTMWPYSIVIIVLTYIAISPVGWHIVELHKQLNDLLIFPRNSDYLETFKDVEDDYSAGSLAPWYVIIPDPLYEEGKHNVSSWDYIRDSAAIMEYWNTTLAADGYLLDTMYGVSVVDNEYVTYPAYEYGLTETSLYRFLTRDMISDDKRASYFTIISDFDPYYKDSIKFVGKARDVMSDACEAGNVVDINYHCYITGGSTNEVDSVNTVFASFTWVLTIIIIVVFGLMGVFFKSFFVPVRLLLTITLPMTFVYGLAVICYEKGGFEGLHWSAMRNTDGMFWIVPVMTVTILIGLALDYDVFLFARIYEYRTIGKCDTRESIVRGVYNTGSVITAAGVIMAIAFCGLVLSQMTSLNQTGFVMVVAVLVDTFIIRTLLVPAVLSMAKEVNWYPGIREDMSRPWYQTIFEKFDDSKLSDRPHSDSTNMQVQLVPQSNLYDAPTLPLDDPDDQVL